MYTKGPEGGKFSSLILECCLISAWQSIVIIFYFYIEVHGTNYYPICFVIKAGTQDPEARKIVKVNMHIS